MPYSQGYYAVPADPVGAGVDDLRLRPTVRKEKAVARRDREASLLCAPTEVEFLFPATTPLTTHTTECRWSSRPSHHPRWRYVPAPSRR